MPGRLPSAWRTSGPQRTDRGDQRDASGTRIETEVPKIATARCLFAPRSDREAQTQTTKQRPRREDTVSYASPRLIHPTVGLGIGGFVDWAVLKSAIAVQSSGIAVHDERRGEGRERSFVQTCGAEKPPWLVVEVEGDAERAECFSERQLRLSLVVDGAAIAKTSIYVMSQLPP